jgi:hypothetical protein
VKNNVLLAIVVVLFLAAGARALFYFKTKPPPGEPVATMMPGCCDACGKNYAAMIGAEPSKCGYCEKMALYRAFKCLDCEKIFPRVQPTDKVNAVAPPPTVCKFCGSNKVSHEISPDELGEPPPE